MSRALFWVTLIYFIYTIHLSDATNCTLATFNHNLDAGQVTVSKIDINEYTSTTQDQIVKNLGACFLETPVYVNCTQTNTSSSYSFSYRVIYGCNETTASILPNGTVTTVNVNKYLNSTKLQQSVSCGLADRVNQVSLKAQQISAGANDTLCNFNLGSDDFFEWTIETSTTSFNAALLLVSSKSADALYNALLTVFRTKLMSLYPNQIANVSFISQTTLPTGRYGLTFRVYFLTPITNISLRTDIVSNIQLAYYGCIKTYFTLASKSFKIPTSVKISTPSTVSCQTKKAVLINNANLTQLLQTGGQVTLSHIFSLGLFGQQSGLSQSSTGKSDVMSNVGVGTTTQTSTDSSAKTGLLSGVLSLLSGVINNAAVVLTTPLPFTTTRTTTTTTTTTTTPTTTTTTTTPTTTTTTPTTTTTTTTPTTTTTTPTTTTTTTTPTTTTTTPTTTTTTTTPTTTTTTPTTTTTTTTPTTTTTTPTTTTITTTPTTTTTTPTTTTTTPTTTTTTPTTTTTTPTTTTTTTTTTTPTTTTTTPTTPTTTTTTPTTTTTTPTTTTTTTPTTTTTTPTTTTTTPTTTTTTSTTTTTTTTPTTATTTTTPTTTTTTPTTTTTTPTTTTITTTTPTTTTTAPTTTTTTPTTTTTAPTTTTTTPTTTTTTPTTTTTAPTTTTTTPTTTTTTPTTTTTTTTTTSTPTTHRTKTSSTRPSKTTRNTWPTKTFPTRPTWSTKTSSSRQSKTTRHTWSTKTSPTRPTWTTKTSPTRPPSPPKYPHPYPKDHSNGYTDIIIKEPPYVFKNLNNFKTNGIGLLAYLIKQRFFNSLLLKSRSSACTPADVYVNYVYEYDMHNLVFNSSFQDLNSVVVQALQTNIADWTSDEVYKRNLVSDISGKATLIKIIDVSQEYSNRPTIRFYVSIDSPKSFIPVLRNVFDVVFEKLQEQSFPSSQANHNWGNMVLIPRKK